MDPSPQSLSARRLVLHVGASKSGTTAFQAAVANSMDRLAAAGYQVPIAGRQACNITLLFPLGWEAGSGFVHQPTQDALSGLRQALERCDEHSSALLTNEDLAEVDEDIADAVVGLGRELGFDVHVVVTVRDWGKQLPSEWQQFLKHRISDDFPTFLHSVRDRSGFYGQHFRRRQDFAAICERWGRRLPADHVHVVMVPTRDEEPRALFATMATVMGLPGDTLVPPARDVNRSYGVVEAEVYRRLNAELTRRHPGRRKRTFGPMRKVLSQGALRRSASQKLRLPPEHYTWVCAEAEDIVQRIRQGGYAVHGDLDRLLPRKDETGPLPEVREEDVARAAVQTLAAFAEATVLAGSRHATRPTRPGRPAPGHRWLLAARRRLRRLGKP